MLPRLLAIPLAAAILPQAPALRVSLLARAVQPGEAIVLTIDAPAAVAAVRVRAFDREWPAFAVDDDTWRTVLGIDLDVAPAAYRVEIRAEPRSGGAIEHVETLTVADREFRTRRLTVDPAFVNPPSGVQARIAREAKELAALWQSSNATPLWDGPFGTAVPHPANSAFGTRSIFNGEPRSAHGGADFASPAGTPVKAPSAGRILLARELYYTGRTVMVDHGAGVISLFAHLSSVAVKAGTVVRAGQIIGRVGATGRVTGPHLHWTVRASGARVDPLALLHVLGPSPQPPGRTP